MLQTIPRAKAKAISFLVLVAILAVPLLLPGFKGSRPAWLLFVIVLAAIAWLFGGAMTWLHQRIVAIRGNRIGGDSITHNMLGLIASLIVLIVTFHYARLRSDTIFMLVTILGLAAVWLVLLYWRALFRGVAEKLRLGPRTCAVIALLIIGIGFSLHFFLDHFTASFALTICALAALGCAPACLPLNDKKQDSR
jgi:hypothetical protein